MKRSHLVLLLLLNFGWAAVPTLVTRYEAQLNAREFVFLRYAFALAVLLALWPWLPGSLPRGRDFWRTLLMGVAVFNVGHLLQIGGFQLSHASDASIVLALDPLVCSIGAALFLQELIPGRRWAGFATAISGVACLSLWRQEAPLSGFAANLLIVLSFVSEALWSVMGKPLVTRWGIPKVTTLALAAGTIANLATLAPNAGRHWEAFSSLNAGLWLMMAAVGIFLTAFGYSAWHLVIRDVPVSMASMTVYLQPLVGTALAIWLAGETLHAGHLLGSMAIVTGLIIGIRGRAVPAAMAR
jgi:drug/metabolite transporter (DMT)-like permease